MANFSLKFHAFYRHCDGFDLVQEVGLASREQPHLSIPLLIQAVQRTPADSQDEWSDEESGHYESGLFKPF